MPAIGQQWAQFRVKYTGHARPVVSEALGLVALDAAAAALPLANRTPPPHLLSLSICRVTCVVPSVLCCSDENKVIRIAKCDVFSGVCESIR